MRRHRTVLVCAGLALLVVGAIAVQGAPVFGRIVWVPDWAHQIPPRVPVPSQTPTDTPPPQERIHEVRVDLSWFVVLAVVVMLTIAAVLLWRAIRIRLQQAVVETVTGAVGSLADDVPETLPEPEVRQIRRGLGRALDLLAEPREPRDAIEQAWLGLEEAVEESGVRRLPAETPSEFTARILSRVGADRDAARVLLDLYLRVRFGDAPVGADDVATARRSLESLRASWRADSAAGGAAR